MSNEARGGNDLFVQKIMKSYNLYNKFIVIVFVINRVQF